MVCSNNERNAMSMWKRLAIYSPLYTLFCNNFTSKTDTICSRNFFVEIVPQYQIVVKIVVAIQIDLLMGSFTDLSK